VITFWTTPWLSQIFEQTSLNPKKKKTLTPVGKLYYFFRKAQTTELFLKEICGQPKQSVVDKLLLIL
jgi:hypothetical protein